MTSPGNRHCANCIDAHPQCHQRTAIVLLQLHDTVPYEMLF